MAKAKAKQIVVRFDIDSYDKINIQAKIEHRGLGEFVRHATLAYLETLERTREIPTARYADSL